jgi:hypothetical protein
VLVKFLVKTTPFRKKPEVPDFKKNGGVWPILRRKPSSQSKTAKKGA